MILKGFYEWFRKEGFGISAQIEQRVLHGFEWVTFNGFESGTFKGLNVFTS